MKHPPPPEKREAAPSPERTATRTTKPQDSSKSNGHGKPFIPAWLNRAKLSQAEFRVYCCLASRADNKTGIAWPQADTISSDCHMAKNTVWKSLRALESMKLIRKAGKPFAGSNRYQVLVPIGANEIPNEGGTIGANEIPIEQSPIGANQIPPIGANEILQSAQMDSREGSPKNVHQVMFSNAGGKTETVFEPTLEESQFASWFKSSLPQDQQDRLPKNWQATFGKAYREMIHRDRRTHDEIMAVCRWARTDSFWQQNFRSPGKLRQRDKQGTLFFDVFAERMKSTTTSKPAVNLGRRASTIEDIS